MEGVIHMNAMTPVVMAAVESPLTILVMAPTQSQAGFYKGRVLSIASRREVAIQHTDGRSVVLGNTSVIYVLPPTSAVRGMVLDAVVLAGHWEDTQRAKAATDLEPYLRVPA